MGNSERITIPGDLGALARESETDCDDDAVSSEVRPVLPGQAVPWLVVTYEQLRALPLGSRDGYVVSLIDGRSTVEMILDMAGMQPGETMGILQRLLRLGAVELHDT